MTKKLSYTRLSKSRFEALKHLDEKRLSIAELAFLMWGDHRMRLVNARAVIRDLKIAGLISIQEKFIGDFQGYAANEKAKPILRNPSWICRYCTLDTTDSSRRLWGFSCLGCDEYHYVCRFCRRHLIKVTGHFPRYRTQVRACPGKIEVPKRPERKSARPKNEKSKDKAPGMVQGDLYGATAAGAVT